MNKVVSSIHEAVIRSGLKSGMTVSFHHHLREGDRVMEQTLQTIKAMGIGDLAVAATSIMHTHDFLVAYIENGTIRALQTSGLRGRLGQRVRSGILKTPVIIRSHGGRARALGQGDLSVDVAFIAASSADDLGNANGVEGRNTFGSLGYGMWEARHAAHRIIITDTIWPHVLSHISIPQSDTDTIVSVESIGDADLLVAGALSPKVDPLSRRIAQNAIAFLTHAGINLNLASIQMGSGGISLQITQYLHEILDRNQWKLKCAVGGITRDWTRMLEEGRVGALMDVQSFDPACARSIATNKDHHEVDVNTYANPFNPSNLVNSLDIGILSALEIDLNWNVNVLTGSDGHFMGAIGGHPDVAEGAKTTVIVAPLIRKRIPILVEQVHTLITPGKDVDVWVHDWGISVKETHIDWIQRLKKKGVPVFTLEKLYEKATRLVGKAERPEAQEHPRVVVEGRWGEQS